VSKKFFWIIGIAAACLIIGVIMFKGSRGQTAAIEYEGQPFKGDKEAPVNIVEFGDYKCPHCKVFNENAVPEIQKELIDTGKAKFYTMNYPFMAPDSTIAAKFAETVYKELGNQTFWKFHDLLFANQTDKAGKENVLKEPLLEAVLAEVASPEDTNKVMDAFGKGKGNAGLKKDEAMAKRLDIQSTPSIYVNGKLFEGKSIDDLKKMVEDATANGQ